MRAVEIMKLESGSRWSGESFRRTDDESPPLNPPRIPSRRIGPTQFPRLAKSVGASGRH